ncbi:MAG TPA: hypothetical protein DET40_08190 [Lentisphaeria bacterium]|nr:MAG: hypothetical protein A2X45_10400 [Lentisphaerae bacterium GWF2_50_93]HCE43512.1 hypothetical protein [Lentisphaeria bacterium]
MKFPRKKWIPLAIAVFLSINCSFADTSYPTAVLSNNHLKAVVYLPDVEKGYYRNSRFDWSSMISSVQYRGHRYFGDCSLPGPTPDMTDRASGFAEEFKTPLGYDSAAPGDSFLKIGAGIFKRIDGASYDFSRQYPLTKPAIWSVTKGDDWIRFESEAAIPPYSYRYVRKVYLDGATIVIDHTLQNTGQADISNRHYSHNFIIVDGMPVGKTYSVEFNFHMLTGNKRKDIVKLDDNRLDFIRALVNGDFVNVNPAGIADACDNTSAMVFNTDKNAGVIVNAKFPVSHYLLHINEKAICPEPFFNINLKPESSTSWQTRYIFFTGIPPVFGKKEIDHNSKTGLASISIDGAEMEEFITTKRSYNIVLLAGRDSIPKIDASVLSDNFSFSVKQAASLNGKAIISLSSPNSKETVDYVLNFVKSAVAAVTASVDSGNSPLNTLDKDLMTSWAAEGDGRWIMFDFGELKSFTGIGIAWFAGDKRKSRFDIEISHDGKNWTRIFSGESSGTTSEIEPLLFNGKKKARFIRITGHGNDMGKWNNIAETVFYQE